MKGPQKLIEGDGQASAFARELLREGRGEVMPAPARAALWKSIAAQVPGALVGPSAAAAAGAAKGVTGLVALKGALAVVALGGSIWGGHHLLTSDRRRAPVPSKPAPPASSTTKTTPTERAAGPATTAAGPAVTNPASAAVPEVTPPAGIPREAPDGPAPGGKEMLVHEPARSRPARVSIVRDQPGASASGAPASSRLREESQLVLEAREGLRAGRAALVLRQLEDARSRFPGGTLAQEREALTIEALWRSGQTAAARRRAETFARTYPGSPHAARVQQLTSR